MDITFDKALIFYNNGKFDNAEIICKELLKKNPDRISWLDISLNPNSIPIFTKNIDKIHWFSISANPSIFMYDYLGMKRHFYETYGKELIETLHHPKNFSKFGKDGWDLLEEN